MPMSDRDGSIIRHILEYCGEIKETVLRFGDSYEAFAGDKIYRNAVTMCILQIGELAGKLSEEFVEEHKQIPWRSIKAMRNVAAHSYGTISIPTVWDTIKCDIPELREDCEKLI